jgi:YHS domain-containing protein
MNRIVRAAAVLFIFSLAACASMQNQAAFDKAAGGHDFGYYFSSSAGRHTFNDLDAAYAFLNEAAAKFRQAGLKKRVQGLSGIVNGPAPEMGGSRVAAGYFIRADDRIPEELGPAEIESILKDSIGSYLGFIVFYEDRSVIISNYYLQDGWVYTSNSQPHYVEYDGNSYEADYPVGWTMERAFRYLREGK